MVEENENFSFEEKLAELEKIVNNLETGEVSLDDAIEEFKKAMVLVKECDEKLNSAQEAIAKIVNDLGAPLLMVPRALGLLRESVFLAVGIASK
ncbi:MAG: exodeoxyribonuclease VII small subunit, partial [Methanobrevibacter sp.]|nr:exodeoxyribonuclease VII small subunit [Methanobrevibacter sp.]